MCCAANAQSILSSQYPAGVPMAHSTGPSLAIGGAGTGVSDDFFGMADNPANLGNANRAVFSAVTAIDFFNINQGTQRSSFAGFSPSLFSLAFPISKVGAFGVSFDRRSSLNSGFATSFDTTLSNGIVAQESRTIRTIGGINSWQAGWGRSIGRWGQIGVSYERLYLSSSQITNNSAGLDGAIPTSGYDSTTYIFRGNGIRGGILVPVQKFTIGVSGEYIFTGDADVREGSTEGTTKTSTTSLHLPASLSAGVSYAATPSLLTAASCSYTLWRDYYSGIQLGLPSVPSDAVSFSLGAKYTPAPSLLVPRYWEIMQYGAGFRYSQLPAATASESAITLSLGLPVLQGAGLFDVVFELGRRTDTKYKDYSENYCRVMLGINGGGKWFQPTGIRY